MATQTVNVGNLQRDYKSILDKLVRGPVILATRGRATAVILSVEDYDRQIERISFLERQRAGDQAVAADKWLNDDEVTEAFKKAGIV